MVVTALSASCGRTAGFVGFIIQKTSLRSSRAFVRYVTPVLDRRFIPVTADYFKQNLLLSSFFNDETRDKRIVRFAVEEAVAMHCLGFTVAPTQSGGYWVSVVI